MLHRIALATIMLVISGTYAECHAQWATLKGQFLYGDKSAKAPSMPEIKPTKDVQVCGKVDLFEESLVVNEENRGLANVVIWASRVDKIHPDYEKITDPVVLDNKGCRFEPHVVTVPVSRNLLVKNTDPVGHNSLINFLKNPPINPIIPAGGEVPVKLSRAELLPLDVSCSIHPWMKGVVLVQDHPYMAVTDKDGNFELKNLPTGNLSLKVWHEKSGYLSDVKIDGKSTKLRRGRYAVKLSKDEEHEYIVDPSTFK